ncbi:MAG TPA: hypothetical protein PLU87_06910 [Sedimentisphaerales bacterium]|nr:hypothetical protein [Sedimentisphaerales bacterium]HRS10580.1 hypothetical protein [Sedimentisphaerales bacterium]HRV47196.1 hypothetical protein [Sedimentisphaerales bacterium]
MVRTLAWLVLLGVPASPAVAEVRVDVYRADEVTPLALADPNTPGLYRDIMVGTRLTLFITSDSKGIWDGQLRLSAESATVGTICGRGCNPKSPSRNHEGSCLKAAGRNPRVNIHTGPDGVSASLLSAWDAQPGEWFVLDYEAKAVGRCEVELYAVRINSDLVRTPDPYVDDPPGFELDLTQSLAFTHVPSRDFNGDDVVDFDDLARLAAGFGTTAGPDPNESIPFDFNADRRVDMLDVAAFSEYWLERTDVRPSDGSVSAP